MGEFINMASSSPVVVLWISFLSWQLVNAQNSPTIGFISPDQVADIGGTVELTCTIKNGKDYPILWMRLQSEHNKNALPISNGDTMIFKDRRFAVDYDSDAGSYKLTIKDVVKSDEGKYQCQVVPAVDAALVEDVRLDVKIEPTMIAEDSEAMVEAEVGKSSELSCEAEGYPIPKITWRKQDGTLLPNGKETVTGKLAIPDVKREHRGNYICKADNGVGKPKERVITLQVGFPPKVEMPIPRSPQALGYEIELKCNIEAFPSTTIQWLKNGTNIENGANYHINHFASKVDYVTSTLMIYYVYKEDYGKYTCKAGNRYGTQAQEMELYESTMPICPPLCGDTNLNSAKVHYFNIFLLFIPLMFRL